MEGFLLRIGIDIGSTTVKVVLLDDNDKILHKSYERHFSRVREKAAELLKALTPVCAGKEVQVALTGSAGLGVSKASGLDFVQEVFATAGAVERFYPDTDAVIELGGEDAKIIFFTGGLEERMNGSCAGGTGSFIDQMATLLNITVPELDELSARHEKIYSIASRCGVFAKSDIQPLLNQGARKEDIAASILQAVVDQTVAGLAQGRKIAGRVMFLGGPLFFIKGLRDRFVKTLKLDEEHAVFPEDGDCFVGIGAALYAGNLQPRLFDDVVELLENAMDQTGTVGTLPPLFKSKDDYAEFTARHVQADAPRVDPKDYIGDAYLGIDAGSTTTKLALITSDGKILYSYYAPNLGNPIAVVLEQLKKIHEICGEHIKIKGSGVTGYGEELIKNAFQVDIGLVETVAHFSAARHFNKNVDFILDIGGQDMKCFKIRNGAVDSIMLNEACSSGCGSFVETFAKALGYEVAEFAKLGLFARRAVDLGSRCTVFMNSSVKQAQKDGAGVEDISAGLSISIVKNAIYKVIRAARAEELGENIVVQGGTFLNDAVLRSFERELGMNVVRPAIAGIMGAFGAALAAKDAGVKEPSLIGPDALAAFTHSARPAVCKLCTNRCSLTVNEFAGGRKFISGNRCERGAGKKKKVSLPNLYKYKYDKLRGLAGIAGKRGKIGIPMGLNMYENLPFWHAFFTELGFEVVLSPESNRKIYVMGQYTIPSDTVCYPAKLLHGHIEALLDMGIETIFYPCMPYNFDEGNSDNHYNCPVVAYYPELLAANVDRLHGAKFLMPYFGLHRRKDFIKKAAEYFGGEFNVPEREVRSAAEKAYAAYERYEKDIRDEGERIVKYARERGLPMIVLAGRPYHIDPEINHGIDSMITSFGICVLSEDSVFHHAAGGKFKVLNQWTYHSRLYRAAEYVAGQEDMQLVQLVSFGCGIDAITGDETREILERSGKLYTQLKIDEIYNLGAVKIRIRSLLAASEI
ncbi:MAG TPA: 2-hydroxyglutaryl-CoA dehydratase [Ruminococcaceae bacterium]|nr:2-hydroxyglutaryl-CoA dehydratase [Oscillospiraceae bacterium]